MVEDAPKDLRFTAVGKRVIIVPVPDDLETDSGLERVAPDQKTPALGVIISVGPKANLLAKMGDAVYYFRGSGIEIEANGQTLLFMYPDRIIGKAKP